MRMLARYSRYWIGLLACLAMVTASWAADTPRVPPEVVKLPLQIGGDAVEVVAHLYKPPGDGPFPLVIFSHGRAPNRLDRAKLRNPVLVGHANYWLRQGVAVVAPVRPGYGETGGSDREDSFARWDGDQCRGNPDFTRTAEHARDAVVATYQWALRQPWVRKDRILLEGQSVGGLATVAAGALNLPGVVGFVNFAGGTGGNPERSPGKSCMPENLMQIYAVFGRQAREPSLWLYAENDHYWGADVPKQWYAAFQAGGSDARLVQTGPVPGHDGHQLLNYGGAMWSEPLNAFVRQIGLLSN